MLAELYQPGVLLAGLSCVIWLYLTFLHGRFWWADQRLSPWPIATPQGASSPGDEAPHWPRVVAVIPARNEADVVAETVRSLLSQDYPTSLHIVLVDDHSEDGTAAAARAGAEQAGLPDRLEIITGAARPPGWTGKMWAVSQGVAAARARFPDASWLLLTDADIAHHPTNLRELMQKALGDGTPGHPPYGLVSLMVRLHCRDGWERLLIPAFVYFFQQLYPFPRVNDPRSSMAGAAGGCMLVRWAVLEEVGGIDSIASRMIDDCALAAQIKPKAPVWLGLSAQTRSQRPYEGLEGIWKMVARTAYTQLRYSPWLLGGTVLGLILTYLAAPLCLALGLAFEAWMMAALGGLAWALMTLTYRPTLRLYGLPAWFGLSLPLAAALYTLMTIDSAWSHWRGRGGAWKGRIAGGVTSASASASESGRS